MECYIYKGQKYTKQELEDYIKNNPQEFVNSLNTNTSDDIDQNIETKVSEETIKQVEDLFNENTELANTVYEALGFKVDNIQAKSEVESLEKGKETSKKINLIDKSLAEQQKKEDIDNVVKKYDKSISFHPKKKKELENQRDEILDNINNSVTNFTVDNKIDVSYYTGGERHVGNLKHGIRNVQNAASILGLNKNQGTVIFTNPATGVRTLVVGKVSVRTGSFTVSVEIPRGIDEKVFDVFDKDIDSILAELFKKHNVDIDSPNSLSDDSMLEVGKELQSMLVDFYNKNQEEQPNAASSIERNVSVAPEQKQQAIETYSQYLEQNPNGNVEDFKNWIVENKESLQEDKDTSQEDKPKQVQYSNSLLKDSDIITHPNFDPSVGLKSERYEDGTLKFAQVFIASKFKVYNKEKGKYEYIDLREFVLPGTSILDLDKLPQDLLTMFSFRIPTSSHQSGALIEIAGFLPHSMGDLMIVPKDHTVQIGEDYDIDTRYVYQYHYIKTTDGKLKKLEYSDVEKPEKFYSEFKEDFKEAKKLLWESYYENVPKVRGKVTNKSNFKVRLNNSLLKANKEKIMELVFLQDALDNYAVDNLLKTIFKDEYEIDVLSKEYLKERIEELESQIISPQATKELRESLKSEYREIKAGLYDLYKNNVGGILDATKKYSNAIEQRASEEKVIENNVISMYKAVFSSESEDVRQLITKVLSTDFAEDTAQKIAEKSSKYDPNFSIYSPILQRNIMKAGADGKLGIGVHSNAVTINSLIQQLDENLVIFKKEKGSRETYKIKLGNLTFDGVLGRTYDQTENGRQSEYLMISQNSATDNQKLEIMSRRNENADTINVFSLMQLNGLERDGISVEDMEMSYPSLFISQPIIRRYVEILKSLKSSVGGLKTDINREALKILVSEYATNLPDNLWVKDKKGKYIVGAFTEKARETFGKNVNSQYLYDSLTNTSKNDPNQWYVLDAFLQMKEAATELNKLQKFINIENGGLGVSFFDTIELKDTLLNLDNIVNIMGSESLKGITESMIGEKVIVPLNEDYNEEGYIHVASDHRGKHYIKPSNHYSHKIVNSIATGYNTWKSLFPYDENIVKSIIDDVLESSGINTESTTANDIKYKVVSEMKEYSLSDSRTLFPGGIDAYRKDLFIDTESNESLGSYLKRLQKSGSELFDLPFFKELTIEVNNKDYPTLIKYVNGDVSLENNIKIYNFLENLSKSNKELPLERNGKKVTEAELVKDLFRYSIIADQGNGATGFRKLLPISLFSENKVDASLRSKNNINSPRQVNVFYNGYVKSVENLLGGKLQDGKIINYNKVPETQIKSLLDLINKNYKTPLGTPAFTINPLGEVEVYTETDLMNQSTFTRQFIQHNSEILPSLSDKTMSDILSYNKVKLNEDLPIITVNGNTPNFLKYEDNKGEIFLFEKIDSEVFPSSKGGRAYSYYKRIPVLGVHGMNEYNPNTEKISKSTVLSNNFKPSGNQNRRFKISSEGFTTPEGEAATIRDMIKEFMSGNSNNPYKGLVTLIAPFLKESDFQNIRVEVNRIKGDASYDSKTNTITFNPNILTENNRQHIQNLFVEEMLHYVTKNTIGKYVHFTHIENGKLKYENVSPNGTIPSEIITLVNIYNEAFKHYKNKFGEEAFENLVIDWHSKLRDPEAVLTNENSIEGEASYRMANLHEFIAGIFIKDSEFAREMGKKEYLSSGKSILEKFTEKLLALFRRILPEAKKNSISTNVLQSLNDFLNREVEILRESKNTISKPSEAVNNSIDLINKYSTPDTEILNSLSSIEENELPLEDNNSNCIF